MKFGRNTVWLIPLLLTLTFPLWSIPVSKFLTPRGSFDAKQQNASKASHNFNMETVKIVQNQRGNNTAIIRAEKARTGASTDVFIMDSVNADIFDDDGNITNITAKTGEYDSVSKVLTLSDDVIVNKQSDNQFLYTDKLLYDSTKRTVKCPGKTRLTGDQVEINGGSLDYDIPTKTYDIGNRVYCTISGFVAQP